LDALNVVQELMPEWVGALKKAKPGEPLRTVGFEPHPLMIAFQTEEDLYGLLVETISRIPSA
jgi:hypothetical protein